MLKAIDHKSWPYLSKMDEIMPKSTASGRFAHDGAKGGEDEGSGGQSDRESMYDADQGPSNPLFPPSIIAPFMALSQIGPAAASTSAPSIFSENTDTSLPTAPPSSSSAAPLQSSSVFTSPSGPSLASAARPTAPCLPSPFATVTSSLTSPMHLVPSSDAPSSTGAPSQSSISSKGKRKYSAITDIDNQGSLKRRGPRSSSGTNAPAGESAILHGFQGSMNHFSDVIHLNNETQPHTILKDATSKLNGAWGAVDKFTDGQKIVLLKLFRQDQAIASLYASTENSRVRRGYALIELQPYQSEIDSYDAEDI